jgi:hypothetical protein
MAQQAATVVARGFKVVRDDYTAACVRDSRQFTVGSTHTLAGVTVPVLCSRGFHFSREPLQCIRALLGTLVPDTTYRLLEVEALSAVVEGPCKLATLSLRVVRELDWAVFTTGVTCTVDGDGKPVGWAKFRNGLLHQNGDDPEPAMSDTDVDRRVDRWYQNGVPGRVDGDLPMLVVTRPTGPASGMHCSWLDEAQRLHRGDDAPATIAFDADGVATTAIWYVHGERRRSDPRQPTALCLVSSDTLAASYHNDGGRGLAWNIDATGTIDDDAEGARLLEFMRSLKPPAPCKAS